MILLIVLLALAVAFPYLLRRWREEKRRLLLSAQLRESLGLMVHALRVGAGFHQALTYTAKEIPAPLGPEWQHVLQDLQVGRSLTDSLRDLPARIPLREIIWFVAAVEITQASGGSLAEVLETLSESLQQKESLRQKVAALTAQGKASGVLLSALPFVVLLALGLIVPEMVSPMFQSMRGQLMLGAVLMGVAIGGLVIRKIVTLQERRDSVAASLPEALDLWIVVMQAGLDFQVAVSEYLKRVPRGPLSVLMQGFQSELQAGRSRLEVMRLLRDRESDAGFREFCRTVIQGLELGSPLTPLLKRLADALRKKRFHETERLAALAPVKLMFPLFTFIFPTLFIVLLGPVWIAVSGAGQFP